MTALALRQKQTLGLIARLALTVALFAVLWNAAGGVEIANALALASPLWLAAAVATLLLQTALSAQRWRVTAAQLGQDFSAGYALREYFLSQVFNQTVPGAVVGDAARAVRARYQGGLLVAGQAVFFERLAGQIFMFLAMSVAFLCTWFVAGGLEWPMALGSSLLAVISVGLAGLIGVLALATGQFEAVKTAARWLQPLRAALLARKVLSAQLSLGLAILLCNLLAFGFAARAVGIEMSFIELTALVPVVLFAMLVPFTISGWGVREGAAALVLPIAGYTASASVAASIMFGIAILISVLPGALMVLKR